MKLKISINSFLSTEGLACVLLLGAIFLPQLKLPGYALRAPFLGAPIIFFLLLLKIPSRKIQFGWQILCLLLIVASVLLSVLWSYANLGIPYVFGDFAETFKFLQFIPYILIFPLLNKKKLGRVIFALIRLVGVYVALVGLIQIIDPDGMGKTIALLYTNDEGHVEGMASFSRRILLTGTDPNVGGAIAAFFFLFQYAIFRHERKPINIFSLAIYFLIMLFTQSRTALMGVIFSIIVQELVIGGIRIRTMIKMALPTVIVIFAYYIVTEGDLNYISVGFESAMTGDNQSLNVRFYNTIFAFEQLLDSPVFGWGPAGMLQLSTIDSEYALILQRYGLVGSLAFSTYIILYIIRMSRSMTAIDGDKHKIVISHAAFSYMLFSLVLMSTNSLFSGGQLMALVVLLSAGEVLRGQVGEQTSFARASVLQSQTHGKAS